MTPLQTILKNFKEQSKTKQEKGGYFEHLVLLFLSKDKTYSPQFEKVYLYKDWAKNQGISAKDIGVDLVAKNANDEFYTAIQCKFYDADAKIDKKGIDSFIASSDRPCFNRRMFFDTTKKGITNNLETQIEQTKVPFNRVGLQQLENSSIDWNKYLSRKIVEQNPKKTLRPHQQEALHSVLKGLKTTDRGKLIMACGTGKTFASLKIAEQLAGKNKKVLFLAPSLALLSQTITEWSIESSIALHAFAVCSDAQVGKRKVNNNDIAEITTHDLAYPATTNAKKLADKYTVNSQDKMTVVFATYQSIEVISKAQKAHGLGDFDVIICDEAHRTTGATLKASEDSHFVKIHNQDFIAGNKRVYMTATPRVYITKVKTTAKVENATLYSMDDENYFGKNLYVLRFGDAVEKELLSDYKVLVLALDEAIVTKKIQKRFTDSQNKLTLDEAIKIIGCYKALAKAGISDTEGTQTMQKAVAFCKDIKSSKLFKDEFNYVVSEYLSLQKNTDNNLICEIDHVDGTMNTTIRNTSISWLKDSNKQGNCRILSNVRCLSEGVDIPSLDAVLFVHPRKSKVDIVQSVGRVMRKAAGKKLGYVILPIVIPAGIEAKEALKDNKNYEIVWDVLNALRSHDERLDAQINQAEFGELPAKMEIISEVSSLPSKKNKQTVGIGGNGTDSGDGSGGDGENNGENNGENAGDNGGEDKGGLPPQLNLDYEYDSVQKAILSKIVDKCGTRIYWESWASDVAQIAKNHITRINAILKNKNSEEYQAFEGFLKELQKNVNSSITSSEVIEMLAQHMITKPVFDALFNTYDFTKNNPVSQAIQKVLDVLNKHNIDNESKSLEKFYESIRRRVDGVESAYGKQKIVVELYDKFFRTAFPKMTERLGIVYTPVECVDFIIHSVNDVLKNEFKQSLGDKNTHIIDPFTGTGTFITRLIQSGLISKEQLNHKYNNELHANEIVLLAYYIATINIETTYHGVINQDKKKDDKKIEYLPFNGICLTDTFQLYENKKDLLTPQLPVNSARLNNQKNLDIKVIIGNPPYSAGQSSGNDNNQNLAYEKLDKSISETYVKTSLQTGNKNSLYDSYIRAIKWASDRIGDTGVIGFITNGGWIESNSSDGMRKTLKEEFSNIYIFHLRGNARTSGELRRKEKDNIFGMGTRTPVAIAILVKNPQAKTQGNIYFYDIGDYLNRDEKLNIIKDFGSINAITDADKWQTIQPDKYHDWLNQRDDSFYTHIVMGDKKDKTKQTIFENYSRGIGTSRDAWVYNASKQKLEKNIRGMIDFYNSELARYQRALTTDKNLLVKDFVKYDKTKISWNSKLLMALKQKLDNSFHCENTISSLYRPFNKINCYFDNLWTYELAQMPKIFPETGLNNLVIGVSGKGASSFSCLISNYLPDLEVVKKSQCFPLTLYEPINTKDEQGQNGLFANNGDVVVADSGNQYTVKDGISDTGLKHFTDFYNDISITKEDLFYYIYGLLHSEDYKKRFINNLVKDLPHIPKVKNSADFKAFSKAGETLADLHINYEEKLSYPVNFADNVVIDRLDDKDFYVQKMKFKSKEDKSSIIYNANIVINDIPPAAYDYIVNGKSAIEWIMDRQRISTHKDSQITNNPNDWANETMNNPKYPLELLLKVMTISVESVKIIKTLPKLVF